MTAPRNTIGRRIAAVGAAVGAVFTGGCVHDYVPVQAGRPVKTVQRRKGWRSKVGVVVGIAETCTLCGKSRAGWVTAK